MAPDYVEVPAIGPVVPEVDHLKNSSEVHEENGVELKRPRLGFWGGGGNKRGGGEEDEDSGEKEDG